MPVVLDQIVSKKGEVYYSPRSDFSNGAAKKRSCTFCGPVGYDVVSSKL
jgi:hypothetical protein